ncbi:MAG: 30S ribosomal protein S6 [Candidatus Poribacteria bacterium]|nr:30S ribosomal protein S6 [Candidatus Poribacteria bacterium]
MRQYETIFIVNPNLEENETNSVIEGVKTVIETNGGKILTTDIWGKRRLAYPIKRHNDGYYALLVFESDPKSVRELNTYYRIAEPIIKYMVVNFEGEIRESQEDVPVSNGNEDADEPRE